MCPPTTPPICLPWVDIPVIVARTTCRVIQLCQWKLILARRAARCSGQVSMVRALSAADRVVHPRNPRSRRPPHLHHTCGCRSCDVLLVAGDADHASRCAQRQRFPLCVKKKLCVKILGGGGDFTRSGDAGCLRDPRGSKGVAVFPPVLPARSRWRITDCLVRKSLRALNSSCVSVHPLREPRPD